MGYIINSFMVSAAGGGSSTTKVTVRLAEFDSFDACSCTLSSTYETWENDFDSGGGDLTLSVGDWVSSTEPQCGQVTALNATESEDDYTNGDYSSCSDCNDTEMVCVDEGEWCLLPHMLVKLISGSLVKVVDLNLGDLIESPYGFTEVTTLIKDHPRDGYYIIENELYISNDHPILVDGKMVQAKDYAGDKRYVKLSANTVYVGTVAPTFNVYCENNVYTVDGQYKL